ncbi:MAG: hypothetical protein Q9213_003028 [Squamulea squamosa]
MLLIYLSLLLFSILLSSLPTTFAVDISFSWEHKYTSFHNLRDPIIATCPNQPAGVCCIPHRSVILQDIHETFDDYMLSQTTFHSLYLSQFGAGWAASGVRYENIGCTGLPILRVLGTVNGEAVSRIDPERQYDDDNEELAAPGTIVFAASWVDLRTRFPVSSEGMRYLAWQGVKRMVWGMNTLTVGSGGVPLPNGRVGGGLKKRDGKKVVNGWARSGDVDVATPRRWRYPSLYEVNGTRFEEGGDGVFRNAKGTVLEVKSREGG